MRRRKLVVLLCGAAAWPTRAVAQPSKLPVIGFLGAGTATAWSQWVAAFVQRLHELGWRMVIVVQDTATPPTDP